LLGERGALSGSMFGFNTDSENAAHRHHEQFEWLYKLTLYHVRFEIFTAVTMKNAFEVFTAVTMKNVFEIFTAVKTVVFCDIKTYFVPHRKHITSPLQSPAG
jgi:hypothetical protein